MKEGLSRRELVAVLGAGMAVSACTPEERSGSANQSDGSSAMDMASCGNVGLNPHGRPTPGKFDPPNFTTEYIAILCIELGDNWSMTINHANFHLEPTERGEPEREAKALAALNESWKDNTKSRKKFRENASVSPRNRGNGNVDDHSDFDYFRFNKPIELFVYVYQDKVRGRRAISPEGRLLSFGPFMQETDENNNPLPAIGNCSYFRARLVDLSDHGKLNDHGFLFRVENWSRDPDGTPVGADEVRHSMNIHFSIPSQRGDGSEMRMPMVFDPDTGNGTGNEP